MSDQDNWRVPDDALDYFAHQQKKTQVADRRPVIRRPVDLVGPGIAVNARRLDDLNELLATYNGYYSVEPDTPNAPAPGESFVGITSSDSELGGYQQFRSITSGLTYQRSFTRNPLDAETIYWGNWTTLSVDGHTHPLPPHSHPPHHTHTDTGWTLLHSGLNIYVRKEDSRVWLRGSGSLSLANGANTTIGTNIIPEAFRPISSTVLHGAMNTVPVNVKVWASGILQVWNHTGANRTNLEFDGSWIY